MHEVLVSEKRNVVSVNSMTFDEREKELEKQKKQEEEELKRARNSPFSNFYQFNRDHTKDMLALNRKSPTAHSVLIFLLDKMDNYNAVVCSNQVIMEVLRYSRSTVSRAIKVLKESNFIAIYKSGTTNIYTINKNLAWSSWGTNYKYAEFDAKIIISESEQENEIKLKTLKHKEIAINE